MNREDLLNKIRQWDNLTVKWMLRHFYFLFFEIVLVVIFLISFVNTLNVVDLQSQPSSSSSVEQGVRIQAVNSAILIFLMILNSFWMLFIFNVLQRFINLLKDISFALNKMRYRP